MAINYSVTFLRRKVAGAGAVEDFSVRVSKKKRAAVAVEFSVRLLIIKSVEAVILFRSDFVG